MRVTVDEQLAWILERITLLAPVRQTVAAHPVALEALHGSVLAADVQARHDMPLWANSAMDGYAVRSADTRNASDAAPARLRVLGEVAAGSSWDPPLCAGDAVRIMTGAPIPSDADAVARVEITRPADNETEITRPAGNGTEIRRPAGDGENGELDFSHDETWADDTVAVSEPVTPGTDLRGQGEDLQQGDPVARAGDRLTAARLSAIAAAGVAEVLIRRPPRVAVLVTGAELRTPGEPLERGQIPESNTLLVAGLLAEAGVADVRVERCVDDEETVRTRLAELGAAVDVIVTTGGVGPGTRDVMRLALEDEPGVRAVRVAVKPGQPQCCGTLRAGAFVFALPGNPVSAAVSFELFVRPALLAMQGADRIQRRRIRATARTGWRGATGRLQVIPVVLSEGNASNVHASDGIPEGGISGRGSLLCAPAVSTQRISHSVGGFGARDGYALVAADRGDIAVGDEVDVLVVKP